MKNTLFLIISLLAVFGNAEIRTRVFMEKTDTGIDFFAENLEYCPVSVQIDFDVYNLKIPNGNHYIYRVEPNADEQLLTSLTVMNPKDGYEIRFSTRYNYGDHNLSEYDREFEYHLPFLKSQSFKINQGYNGDFSHWNENALDFNFPEGTAIAAIREGVVTEVIDSNNKSCPQEKCKVYNNKVIIYQSDGTFAEYDHIKFQGALVSVGDSVKQGQTIGYSGSVGWSSGPHLHLVVFKQKLEKRITLKTRFKIGDGNIVQYLKEKQVYTKEY